MDILRCRRQGDETQKLRGEDRLSHKEEKETGKGPKPETARADKISPKREPEGNGKMGSRKERETGRKLQTWQALGVQLTIVFCSP